MEVRGIKFKGIASEDFEATSIEGISKGDWVYGYYVVYHGQPYIITQLTEECGGVGSGLVDCFISIVPETVEIVKDERLCRKAMKASREETAQEIFKELRQRGVVEEFTSFLGDTLHRFVMGLPILNEIEEEFKEK